MDKRQTRCRGKPGKAPRCDLDNHAAPRARHWLSAYGAPCANPHLARDWIEAPAPEGILPYRAGMAELCPNLNQEKSYIPIQTNMI